MRQHFRYFFKKGLSEVKVSDSKEIRERLVSLISPERKSTYYAIANRGWRDIPVHMYNAITALFGEYGVREDEVWEIQEI